MDLANLPQDIILLVLSYLEAHDLLCCQSVCQKWQTAFSDETYIRTVLKSYPHAREVRSLLSDDQNSLSSSFSSAVPKDLVPIFHTVARRYYHLMHGKICSTKRYPILALDQSGHWHPTPQWDYHESQPGGRLYHESANHVMSANRKPYLFRQSLWSYNDGFVVYAPREATRLWDVGGEGWDSVEPWRDVDIADGTEHRKHYALAVLDIGSDEIAFVPFDITDRVIRNLRLIDGTLIIEWAEREPFHDLNLVDKVHRHFATIYDIGRQSKSQDNESQGSRRTSQTVSIVFRSELKIHFLGLPLTARDYFFTTHTKNYYAMYLWQPNRSLWTGDEDQPIEALFVWDIRNPSTYRPSKDPGNSQRGQHGRGGPVMINRFSFRELEFLGIRQRANIAFINLELEELEKWGNIIWKENVFVSGQGYFDPAERNWRSRITSFPFKGEGPTQVRVGEEELVAYRGAVSMESCELEEDEVEKWFLPVMDVIDRDARVRFALLETCFTGMGMINRIMVRIKVGEDGEWENMEGAAIEELSLMGRIAGDERWIVGMNGKLEVVVGQF